MNNSILTRQESDRVRRNTCPEVLQAIDRQIEANIRFYAAQPPDVLTRRIEALEHEWDLERTLEMNASTLALTSAFLGLTSSKKWLVLTGTVMGFLLQHAIQGWCPPVPIFRRLGFRTRGEIDREKFALKALRGDFRSPAGEFSPKPRAKTVLKSVSA